MSDMIFLHKQLTATSHHLCWRHRSILGVFTLPSTKLHWCWTEENVFKWIHHRLIHQRRGRGSRFFTSSSLGQPECNASTSPLLKSLTEVLCSGEWAPQFFYRLKPTNSFIATAFKKPSGLVDMVWHEPVSQSLSSYFTFWAIIFMCEHVTNDKILHMLC